MPADPTEERVSDRKRLFKTDRLFSALRYPQYRNFWLASVTSLGAQQITIIAQGWLVYELTDSALYLGYAGLVTAVPAIILSLAGGVMADRMELRRLLAATQVLLGAFAAVLATITALGLVEPWHVLIYAFLNGSVLAFNNPARQAIYPQLIDRKDLMNAVTLNSMAWQGTRVVAPAAGGLVLTLAGSAAAFYVCAIGYTSFAFVVMSLSINRSAARRGSMVNEMRDGVRYIIASSVLAFLIGLTFFNSFFGISVMQIFPVFAKDVLDVGAGGLGVMLSAIGVGSVAGLIFAGLLGDYERKGLLIIGGATVYGFALILFSLSTFFPLSLLLLFFVGAFSQIYMISVQTTIQMRVPDELRGRVMGIYTMTYNMGPLGAMQAGGLADAFGPSTAVFVGGSAIIIFALALAFANPRVRRLQTQPEPAAA